MTAPFSTFSVGETRLVSFHFSFCTQTHFAKDTEFRDTRDASRLFLTTGVGSKVPAIHPQKNPLSPLIMVPGSICLVPRGMPLAMNFPAGTGLIAFHFQAVGASGADLFPDEGLIHSLEHAAPWAGPIQTLLAHGESESRGLALRHLAISLAWAFTAQIHPEGIPEDRLLARFPGLFQYLSHAPPASVKIRNLALAEGQTGEALSKAFRRAAGISLKDFLIQRTVGASTRALLFSDRPLRALARDLGFPTEEACSKFIKTHTGLAPRPWREKHRFQPYGAAPKTEPNNV